MLRCEDVHQLPPHMQRQALAKLGLENKTSPAPSEKKPPKYRNRKVTVNGITYDSEGEYKRYCELQLLEQAGQISGLIHQKPYILQHAFVDTDNKYRAPIVYIADFEYMEGSTKVIEDYKSVATRKDKTYQLKKKLLLEQIASGKVAGKFIETIRK